MSININHKKITIYSLLGRWGHQNVRYTKWYSTISQTDGLQICVCVCKMCSRADFSSCNPDFISAAIYIRSAAYLLAGYPIFFYIVLLSTLDI